MRMAACGKSPSSATGFCRINWGLCMKVVGLTVNGVASMQASSLRLPSGERFYALCHGEEGRGRSRFVLPLSPTQFPCDIPAITQRQGGGWECANGHSGLYSGNLRAGDGCPKCLRNQPSISNVAFDLKETGNIDAIGNPIAMLARSERTDSHQLVFWSLSPGFRGGAFYSMEGDARVFAKGQEAQGIAGRMGCADCPVVLVTGPAILRWTRTGRLYGKPANWEAHFNGETWSIGATNKSDGRTG